MKNIRSIVIVRSICWKVTVKALEKAPSSLMLFKSLKGPSCWKEGSGVDLTRMITPRSILRLTPCPRSEGGGDPIASAFKSPSWPSLRIQLINLLKPPVSETPAGLGIRRSNLICTRAVMQMNNFIMTY